MTHRDELTELYAAMRDENEMNPSRSFQPDDHNISIKSAALGWLRDQGASTVLLFALCAMIAWGGHYSITIALPAHLKQIQDGYIETEKSHAETEKANREANKENLKQILDFAEERRAKNS